MSPRPEGLWTAKQDRELRKHVAAGKSAADIAKIMGLTRNAVCGRKFRLGIFTGPKSRRYSHDDLATITAMRKANIEYWRIAKALKRTLGSVTVKAFKMGIMRPRLDRRAA